MCGLRLQGCKHCPNNEDVWLEAARLEKPQNAKAVVAKARSVSHRRLAAGRHDGDSEDTVS